MILGNVFQNALIAFMIVALLTLCVCLYLRRKHNVHWMTTFGAFVIFVFVFSIKGSMYQSSPFFLWPYLYPMIEIIVLFEVIKNSIKMALSARYGLAVGQSIASTYLFASVVTPSLATLLNYVVTIVQMNTDTYYYQVEEMLIQNEIPNLTASQYIQNIIIPAYNVPAITIAQIALVAIVAMILIGTIIWQKNTLHNKKLMFAHSMMLYYVLLAHSLWSFGLMTINALEIVLWGVSIMLLILWWTYEKGTKYRIGSI